MDALVTDSVKDEFAQLEDIDTLGSFPSVCARQWRGEPGGGGDAMRCWMMWEAF